MKVGLILMIYSTGLLSTSSEGAVEVKAKEPEHIPKGSEEKVRRHWNKGPKRGKPKTRRPSPSQNKATACDEQGIFIPEEEGECEEERGGGIVKEYFERISS
jgi:hypothetical protein